MKWVLHGRNNERREDAQMELDVSLSDSRFWQVAIRLKHYFVSSEQGADAGLLYMYDLLVGLP